MRILVTGGTGFVGAYVVRMLAAKGHDVRMLVRSTSRKEVDPIAGVTPVEADLLDEASVRRACEGAQGLVHSAAHNGYWRKINEVQWKVNVEATEALFRVARESGISRAVHVSSVATISASRKPEICDENSPYMGDEIGIFYAKTKLEGEKRALAAASNGMQVVVCNPTAVVGPRLDARPTSSLVELIRSGKMKFAPPGGISFTDVEDVANGIVGAFERGRPGERYILGGHNLTFRQFYEAIAARHVGPRTFKEMPPLVGRVMVPISIVAERLGVCGPAWSPEKFRFWGWYVWVDCSKAKRELGYEVRPLPQIIARAATSKRSPEAAPVPQ